MSGSIRMFFHPESHFRPVVTFFFFGVGDFFAFWDIFQSVRIFSGCGDINLLVETFFGRGNSFRSLWKFFGL